MTRSRIRGCLLGGAIGDALGAPVEFDSLAGIRRTYGPDGVTDLVASAYGPPGLVTDDTQMTLFTAEALLDRTRDLGADLHAAYLRWLATQETPSPPWGATGLAARPWLYAVRAPGNACLSGLRAGRRGTLDDPVNPGSKGCGTVMRAAPFGLANTFSAGDGMIDAAFTGSALTHGHPTAHHSSAALALLVRFLVDGRDLEAAVEHAVALLRRRPGHEETTAALAAAVRAARRRPSPEGLISLGEGWVAEEALAMSVYCALAHPGPDAVRDALLLAVNHGGDSDSTGAITGNLVGARHGEEALPGDWVAVVEGRDDVRELADRLAASPVVIGVSAAPRKAVARYDRLSRVRGLLLGLALGDALGRPDQPVAGMLRGTATTQLACATVEGLIRGHLGAAHRGIGPIPVVVWFAYQRWAVAQGIPQAEAVPTDGWLWTVPAMAQRRGDAPAMVAALQDPSPALPVGPPTSAGHHAVTRTLPLACADMGRTWADVGPEWVDEVAGWTHGDGDARRAAVEVASLARALLDGTPLDDAVGSGVERPHRAPDHSARSAADGGIALARACTDPRDIGATLRSARSVPASAEGVGPVAGALLGARFGVESLPVEDVARLELAWAVDVLARDVVAQFADGPGGFEYSEAPDRHWWTRYGRA